MDCQQRFWSKWMHAEQVAANVLACVTIEYSSLTYIRILPNLCLVVSLTLPLTIQCLGETSIFKLDISIRFQFSYKVILSPKEGTIVLCSCILKMLYGIHIVIADI